MSTITAEVERTPDTEQDDLRRGFSECWRVLRPGGTLVFKWADKLDRVQLIIAAFWQEDDNTDAVADAVKQADFPRPAGYSAGAVVAFRREVADSPGFRRDLERFDLAECNRRPA